LWTQVAVSHVKELNSWLAGAHGDRAGVHFGAAINLTDIDSAIDNVLSLYGQDSCGHLLSMRQQLKWFASRQIRNVACIAGNLVTASPISDLNPVLQAADAVVTLAELDDASGDWHAGESTDECGINGRGVRVRHVRVRDFFLAYRKVDIRPTEVMVSVFVPFTRGPLDFARAFKQARRRDDDISIVTSAFTMQLRALDNADTEACEKQQQLAIADVSLSFGGVGPCTRTAPLCEEFLRGKVFNAQTFENAYEVLAKVASKNRFGFVCHLSSHVRRFSLRTLTWPPTRPVVRSSIVARCARRFCSNSICTLLIRWFSVASGVSCRVWSPMSPSWPLCARNLVRVCRTARRSTSRRLSTWSRSVSR
jgi:xanthine dehydrogenase/oxidase